MTKLKQLEATRAAACLAAWDTYEAACRVALDAYGTRIADYEAACRAALDAAGYHYDADMDATLQVYHIACEAELEKM